MDVAISGASGFIGTSLIDELEGRGDRVVRLVRSRDEAGPDAVFWNWESGEIDTAGLEGIDAVVTLHGPGIGDRRWTPARKRLVWDSRVEGTALIARTVAGLTDPPPVMIGASAIGFYGDRGDEVLTEASEPGNDFLARLCVEWEAATEPASEAGIRVATIRTGLVVGRGGGFLEPFLLPFKMGIGGRVGSGEQYWSWIALDDQIRILLYALDTEIHGPINSTAPNPVQSDEFVRAFGRALGRPTILPTPIAPLRVLYGSELVDTVLLAGQRVIPARLTEAGFDFRHDRLESALEAAL